VDLPLAVLLSDALVGGEPRQGGLQCGQAVAGGQAHVEQLTRLLRHTQARTQRDTREGQKLSSATSKLQRLKTCTSEVDPDVPREVCTAQCVLTAYAGGGRAMLSSGWLAHLSVVVVQDLSRLQTGRSHQGLPAAVVLRRSVLKHKQSQLEQVCLRRQSIGSCPAAISQKSTPFSTIYQCSCLV